MNSPKIIVAILNKNHVKQLSDCLLSLINQTFKNFVVVIVDGNSVDGSLKMLQEFSNNNPKIHYFLQKSTGTGRARNELIEYVREYFPNIKKIVWGDSENVYDPDYLTNLLSVQGEIVGGVNIIDSDSCLGQSLWWYYNGLDGKGVLGNNEAVQFSLYEKYDYLPIARNDDFFFHKSVGKNGIRKKKAPKAYCYVNTLESFSQFLSWEKVKAKGLLKGMLYEKDFIGILSNSYLVFFAFFVSCLVVSLLLIPMFPLLIIPYILIPVVFSAYMWFKSGAYLKKRKIGMILYFLPVFLIHFSILSLFITKFILQERFLGR